MLSQEQQRTIENSVWVVNTALKKQGLQADKDLRQSAILYMCKCLERFDPNKHIKWTSYAYKNVYLFILRTNAKERQKMGCLSHEDISTLQIPMPQPQTNDESKEKVQKIKNICTLEEKKLIELKLQGYKFAEIGALMGWSISKVNNCMRTIKEKARELEL